MKRTRTHAAAAAASLFVLGLALASCSTPEAARDEPEPATRDPRDPASDDDAYRRALAEVRRIREEREARAARRRGRVPPAPASAVPPDSPLAARIAAAPAADAPRPWFDTAPTWTEDDRGWTRDGGESHLEAAPEPLVVDADGALLEGLYVRGQVKIEADDVTFRGCLFDGAGEATYAVNNARLGAAGLRFEDCEFVRYRSAAIFGGQMELVGCHIHEMYGDGLKPTEDVLVEDCFIHGLGLGEGAHADGAQFVGGGPATFRGCHFWMPWPGAPDAPEGDYRSNAALFICTNNAPIVDVLVEGCWLDGGNYTVYNVDKGAGHGPPSGTRLRFNRIGRGFQYGTLRNDAADLDAVGNVWDDTGAPWTPDGR